MPRTLPTLTSCGYDKVMIAHIRNMRGVIYLPIFAAQHNIHASMCARR
jgi:hypothetical protein